jgi:hypothetical protein
MSADLGSRAEESEGVEIDRLGVGDRGFEAILEIRSSRGERASEADAHDLHADHYLLRLHGSPIAALRVQQARRAQLDCEAFYPPALLASFRSVVCSASRLVRHARARARPSLIRRLFVAAWAHQFREGMRIDLVNVHMPMVNYYLSIGYQAIHGSEFVHPRLGTPSVVMYLIADRERSVPVLRQAFQGAYDPAMTALLLSSIAGGGRLGPALTCST